MSYLSRGRYASRKDINYCHKCEGKLSSKEKAVNRDAGFDENTGFLCASCAYKKALELLIRDSRRETI